MTFGDLTPDRDDQPGISDRVDHATEPVDGDELARIRRRSERLSEMLAILDPPEAEVRRSAEAIRPLLSRRTGRRFAAAGFPPSLRIAAAIAVLIAGGLAVEPARAWVLDRLRAAAEAISDVGAAPPTIDAEAPVSPAAGADLEVRVPLRGDSLYLEVVGGSGVLVIGRSADAAARLRMRGGTDATLVVMSNVARIGGGTTGETVFELDVPATVAAVIIVRSDGSRSAYALEPSGRELRIPLAVP